MTAHGYTLFDTAVGRCGIAWSGRGVAGVQLPEARELETRARVLRQFPGAREAPPPPGVQRALAGIVALLRGEAGDLEGVALDMDRVPPFHRRVYHGIRRGFAIAFKKRELPARRDIEHRGARWKPYRTVASWYLWRAGEPAGE